DVKVLMAEDLAAVREYLSALCDESGNAELRFLEQDAMALLQAAADWRPNVVILDIRMRGQTALGVLESLKRDRPDMAVVVSAFFFEPYFRQGYLRNGADFFFDKSLEWNELTAFLRRRQAQLASAGVDVAQMAGPSTDATSQTVHD
ncbi:MAG: response regulator, partial [Pseudomonadota bacterium]